jgi:3-oxoacyl-[acyl-carrier protein] reductase
MDLGLRGKVAIVGGASQGIGFAIARLLAAEGADVAMVARKADPLAQSVAQVARQNSGRAFAVPADIRSAADCERIVASASEHFGRLDILINNDGAPPLGLLAEFDDAAWQRAIEQNLMSVVRLSRHALPHLRKDAFARARGREDHGEYRLSRTHRYGAAGKSLRFGRRRTRA